MRKLGQWLVLVVVAATFAFSLAMIRTAVGVASPWFGLMVMLVFVGLVAVGRPLYRLRLPGFLRKVYPWETKGTVYRTLHVPAFGELLRRTPLRFLNPMVYLSRHRDDPSAVLAQLESAEAAHLVAAALIAPYVIYACVQSWLGAVAWLMAVQVAFNLYPILHLRWARIRLNRVRERKTVTRSP